MPIVQVTSNTLISLRDWGQIEGTARLGTKPLAGAMIRLGPMPGRMNQSSRISLYVGATTDSEGRFVFDSMPPGEWKVQREIGARRYKLQHRSSPIFSHGVAVTIESGATTHVRLGGDGRTVIGKAVLAGFTGSIPWTDNTVALTLRFVATGAPQQPTRQSFDSDHAFQVAMSSFHKENFNYWTSEQGRTVQRLQREYQAIFTSDGSFKIDDVPAGDYTLKINLTDPANAPETHLFNEPQLGSLEMNVTVPAASEGDNAPVDLGLLQLKPGSQQQASR
jgi:hypothetical protein